MHKPVAPRAFDIAYEGTPSWETGRPQPVVTRLADTGAFGPRVLDAGCGTGLHAVLLASRGHVVTGIDVAPRAIERARARVGGGPEAPRLHVMDAFDLPDHAAALGAPFDTVLDVGLMHVLQPHDRGAYASAVASVTVPGGCLLLVAWSDRNPFGRGPGRISRRDIRGAFRASTGWRVESIEETYLETRLDPGRVHAWLARIRRR